MNTYIVYNNLSKISDAESYAVVTAANQSEALKIYIESVGIKQNKFLEFVYGEKGEDSLYETLFGETEWEELVEDVLQLQHIVTQEFINNVNFSEVIEGSHFRINDFEKFSKHQALCLEYIKALKNNEFRKGYFDKDTLLYIYQELWYPTRIEQINHLQEVLEW